MTSSLFSRPSIALAATLALGSVFAFPTMAHAQSDEVSLMRGAVPDTTPQQRYQSAIREAGGGLKVSIQECRTITVAERRSCEAQARSRYQADMAKAKKMLRDPSVRPIDIVGEPIRSTESVYEIRK